MNAKSIRVAALVHALSFATCFSSLAIAQAKPPGAQSSPGVEAAAKTDWREQYAYTLGMQAYIFGFPYVYLPALRWDWVTRPKSANELPRYAPISHFSHVKALADASYRGGGSPNQDTLYSHAWLDVGKEPVILSHADMGDRYFTFELAGIDSDNFAYVGNRTTGGKAGSFAIVGPADAKTVNALQDQYTLIPLSLWGKKDAVLPASRDVWQSFDPKTDPLAEWRTVNRAMTENPPEAPRIIAIGAHDGVDGAALREVFDRCRDTTPHQAK